MGVLFAQAQDEGYAVGNPGGNAESSRYPYQGYFYRILKRQGKDAPGGAYDYRVGDRMIGGFALVAFPAQYGASGIMTFITNHDGTVFQKDLGEETEAAVRAMNAFNPDKTCTTVETLP
jgi:hypothetical protein